MDGAVGVEALRVSNIAKNFGGIQVLTDVSFTLNAGEYLALIGPNGAGKTTLINILNGILSPSSGEILMLGRRMTNIPVHRRLHLGLACSFQLNSLFTNLSVLDNLLLALQGQQSFHRQLWRSIEGEDIRFQKIRNFVESIGLWDKRNLPVTSLSYGEQRMMEIALSLASEPKVLLLDEPSAGLSESETEQMISQIRNLPGQTAVLFVSHDMDVVFDLADRIIVLSYGVVLAEGKPEDIQANPKVKEIYLGSRKNARDTGSAGTS
jgi:branched-chain amino acid transport system ATP-binding protein